MAQIKMPNMLYRGNSVEREIDSEMGSKHKYVITIPSIDIQGYLAIDDLALIGSKDEIYKKLKRENKILAKYLDSFSTSFNRKVYPSIIVRDESLPKVDSVHLSSFRNAIAVSTVIYSRVKSCFYGRGMGCPCTDIFDFYPISVSSDGTDLSIKTAAELGLDSIDDFRGQTTPAVVYPHNIHPQFDEEFVLTLMSLIEMKYKRKKDKEFKNRVIRSLEMAYYALRTPFVNLGDRTDFGIAISLWVSAFEILANPYIRDVKFSDVSSLIKSVPWKRQKLRQRKYAKIGKHFGKRRTKEKTTLPVQIYGRLYYTRHMYLHGNVIPEGQVEFRRRNNWGDLFFQVPALYRCVLINILDQKGIGSKEVFRSEQKTYERVLCSETF